MFAKDRFIEDCKRAVAEGQPAMRKVVTEAFSDPTAIMAAFGEPTQAGIVPLHRPPELTIKPSHWAMVAPTVLLAGLALVEGLVPAPVFAWVNQALTTILGGNW